MVISSKDITVLRELAEQKSVIASQPIQARKATMWQQLNDLNPVRPMVWINEIPWHEMEINDELKIKTKNPFLQQIEKKLRRQIYKWKHLPADMVVENAIFSPLVIEDSGFGIKEESTFILNLEGNYDGKVSSKHFSSLIKTVNDLDKIRTPRVKYDEEKSNERYRILDEIAGDIIDVKKRGIPGLWWAPWDRLVTWYGVENSLRDLIAKPEVLHEAMDRLVDASLAGLEQLEKNHLLASNNSNVRIGSGGYGYTDDLPDKGNDRGGVSTKDIWGMSAAQIFADVSEKMHDEFALRYEKRWLEKFGLAYYGCCEPLHNKIGILESIPNLRRISMSPWADYSEAAAKIGKRYVISYKPDPAILAGDRWDPELAYKELREDLAEMEGCVIEIIMKDISTVRGEPQRLWEWADIAVEAAEDFA